MVVGGHKRRYQLSPEEHIYGALQLYVDVVNLFIIILGLFGKRS
jgi:protein lifeguard